MGVIAVLFCLFILIPAVGGVAIARMFGVPEAEAGVYAIVSIPIFILLILLRKFPRNFSRCMKNGKMKAKYVNVHSVTSTANRNTESSYERDCYAKAFATIESKIKKGIRPRSKHIGYPQSGKETVRMYLWFDSGEAMELKSEAFDSEEEAKHFSAVFNDCFLYDSMVEKEGDDYFVYSGWVLKSGLLSYGVMSHGAYYEFANAS